MRRRSKSDAGEIHSFANGASGKGRDMSINTEAESKAGKFEVLALTHIDSIYRFALCMAKNESDAQDLVQDTYLEAYKFLHTISISTSLMLP